MGVFECVKTACEARDEAVRAKGDIIGDRDTVEALTQEAINASSKAGDYAGIAENAASRAEAAVPIGEGYSQAYIDEMLNAVLRPVVALTLINSIKG